MSCVYLLEVAYSKTQYDLLDKFKVPQAQAGSWIPERRNDDALLELLHRIGLLDETPEIRISLPIEVSQPVDNLTDYFERFLKEALDKIEKDKVDSGGAPNVVGINLMPFLLAATLVDKLVQGIASVLTEAALIASTKIVFFAQEYSWFSRSDILKSLILRSEMPEITVVDLRGYVCTMFRATDRDLGQTLKEIPRSMFEKILRFKNKSEFRNALIYETNINIGHFALPNSHIRTHYDLYDFVQRNNVQEHLFKEFSQLIQQYKKVTIIGEGLELSMIIWLGNRFADFLPNVLRFEPFSGRRINDPSLKKWFEESDCVVVLTDIVNTGETISSVLKGLRSFNEKKKIPIEVFTVVKLKNSPNLIHDTYRLTEAVKINRPYYHPQNCALCQVGQPIKPVNRLEDFNCVDENQLTPLDFWEIVDDCKAMIRDTAYPAGGLLLHRVDTGIILKRYGNWISNVIRNRVRKKWENLLPQAICTVDEESGKQFARLVGEALGVDVDRILAVDRDVLRGAKPYESVKAALLHDIKENEWVVLLVDDGMNHGKTMAQLIDFCDANRLSVLGVLVFDSRLRSEQHHQLEERMGGKKVLALYNWPSHLGKV